jgi:N-acetylmuramoyl-L-alanine amidase
MSRRPAARAAALLLLLALAPGPDPAAAATASEPIVFLRDGQRAEVLPATRGTAELLPLELLLAGRRVSLRSDTRAGSVTLAYQGREAVFYLQKSLASFDGDLRLLSSPVAFDDGRWLVPVDAVPRVIGPLLDVRAEWRPASRLLILGQVAAPRVGVSASVSGEAVRVVLDASEPVPFRVSQETGRVLVRIPRDLIDVAFQQERLTGGIVDLVQYQGGRENLFVVTLGRRFQELLATEEPARLVLEFKASPLPARALPAPQATPRPAREQKPSIVVIDPGHGGSDLGAQGPGGTAEKDITLAIARRLSALVMNQLGYQVFLTRDRDQDLPLDDRTAIANSYKASLFVSIHANASRARRANGSEVYFLSYQASDDESRRVAQAEGSALPEGQEATAGDLAMILWDMAQAEHLEASSALASRIEEELTAASGEESRGVKQAPFRVLVGAAMPAVLVEVGFISNPEEEKLLSTAAHQAKLASAVARGIARFERERSARAGEAVTPAR